MKDKQHSNTAQDKKLFIKMKRESISPLEKRFFSMMEKKQEYESAFANELLVFEQENPDGLFLLRKYYDTYLIGYKHQDGTTTEYECETLFQALSLRLDMCIQFPKKITLWEWLRDSDYEVVRYDRNYDE